tara:strand:+ start:47 stop:337 length:291 start_codon:yes stop_codon:yes gene_type:complete
LGETILKKTIKLTLEETDSYKEYSDLRDEMVEDLVSLEITNPTQWSAYDHEWAHRRAGPWSSYKEVLWCLFSYMTDADIQDRHNEHLEYFEEREVN